MKKLEEIITSLRDQEQIEKENQIRKHEDWEARVGEIIAVLDEVHQDNINKLENSITELRRRMNESHATMTSEIKRMGEQIRANRKYIIGKEEELPLPNPIKAIEGEE